MDYIQFEELPAKAGKLGIIILQRPQALNALTCDMICTLTAQLKIWATDDTVRAVIIKSGSERAFCAGGDIRKLYENRGNVVDQISFFEAEYNLNYLIGTYPKPYIALLNGITMGGGAGISIHGSHRVACENLMFAMPETGIGLFPDIGASHFLNKAPGFLGAYLGMTGARIGAADAMYANLVDFYISSNHYPQLIDSIANEVLPHGGAHQRINEILSEFSIKPDESSLAKHQSLIDGVFCADSMYRLMSYLSDDNSEWSQAVHDHLLQKSPMSLAATLRMMQAAKDKDLAFCIKQDFTLVQSFLVGHDLYEGIRAVVIDKDMKPKWDPANVDDISDDQVKAYFEANNKKSLD